MWALWRVRGCSCARRCAVAPGWGSAQSQGSSSQCTGASAEAAFKRSCARTGAGLAEAKVWRMHDAEGRRSAMHCTWLPARSRCTLHRPQLRFAALRAPFAVLKRWYRSELVYRCYLLYNFVILYVSGLDIAQQIQGWVLVQMSPVLFAQALSYQMDYSNVYSRLRSELLVSPQHSKLRPCEALSPAHTLNSQQHRTTMSPRNTRYNMFSVG